MTKKQRDRVVVLLRCAADLMIGNGEMWPRLAAARYLGVKQPTWRLVDDACDAVGGERTEEQLLEAAARVEEGSWP